MKKKVLQRIAVMMTALAAVCLLFAPVDSKAEKTGKASMTWKVVEQDDETGNTLIDEPKIASNYTGQTLQTYRQRAAQKHRERTRQRQKDRGQSR